MYLDTHRNDDDLDDIEPHLFDEIQLVSQHGHFLGEMAWSKVQLIIKRTRGTAIPVPVKQRLLVQVDHERSLERARYVRIALGLPPDATYEF